MSQITPARTSLRETLLDAAANLLADRGFQGLRMADAAAAAGVSRQTVYNEFGNKEAMVQAVALRLTGEFLAHTAQRLAGAGDLLTGIRAATGYILRHAAANRLVGAILTGADAEDMLPFLTTRGAPVLSSATEIVCRHLCAELPGLPEDEAARHAETVVRLTVSHLLLPSGDPGQAAEAITAVAEALLGPHLSTEE